MLTFNPKFKFFIYIATALSSTYIGIQLNEALCIENCNLDKREEEEEEEEEG